MHTKTNQTSRIRTAVAGLAALAAATFAMAAPSPASAAPVQYWGDVDSDPSAHVDFRAAFRNNGELRRVGSVTVSGLYLDGECGSRMSSMQVAGPVAIDGRRNNRFHAAESRYTYHGYTYHVNVDGRIRANGTARGTVLVDVEHETRGIVCGSGLPLWTARP